MGETTAERDQGSREIRLTTPLPQAGQGDTRGGVDASARLAGVAEVQRDLYEYGAEFMLEMSTPLVRLRHETVKRVARPLETVSSARQAV